MKSSTSRAVATFAPVARTVARHPGLWPAAAAATVRLAPTGWWHRPPFLPLPDPAYWRFRLVTAYGGDGDGASPSAQDIAGYLRWCQRMPGAGG